MDHANQGPGVIAQQYRQAVGYEYCADIFRAPAEGGITLTGGRAIILIDIDGNRAVHLFQPSRFGWQKPSQEGAVLLDGQRVVTNMIAQIETGIR